MSFNRTIMRQMSKPSIFSGTSRVLIQRHMAVGRHESHGTERNHQAPARRELFNRAAAEPSQPLAEPLRGSLQQRLGHDFSQVRVHSGTDSASAAERIGARAYTLGNDIHLGAEARGLPANEYRRLLIHEAVHTVQQGGRTAPPSAGLTVSTPADGAEREAEHIAQAGLPSLAMGERVRATAPDPTITRAVAPHIQRDLTGKKSVKDGDFDLNLKTESHPGATNGMSGTIKFKPNETSPDSNNIRILQIVKNFDLTTNKDYVWPGGEANRNKMMTSEDKKAGVKGGYFVDHSAAAATPRTAKKDAAVSPYYRDYWPNPSSSQDGSKKGKTINEASIWDYPGSAGNRRFSFETAVKAADTGYIYATLTWGFTISDASKGTVNHEFATANRGTSATFGAAVKAFNEFYKNPGASTAP